MKPTKRQFAGSESHMLELGDRAPDFDLRRSFEESVRLQDLIARGPVVLVFYVFDFGHV